MGIGIFIGNRIGQTVSPYWTQQNAPSNLTTELITGGVRLTWVDNSTGENGFEIWGSVNSGTYTLLVVTDANVTTYDDIRAGGVTMDYKVRGFKGYSYSDYSNIEGDTDNLILQCDATNGVAVLLDLTGYTGSTPCVAYYGDGTHATLTMDDTLKHLQVIYGSTDTFYINITNASSLKGFQSSQHHADVSCFNHCINLESIVLLPGVSPYMAWTGSCNGWSTTITYISCSGGINDVTGDVSRFTNLTYWNSYGGASTFYGNLNQSGLTYIYIGGQNTIVCTVTGMLGLTHLEKVGAGALVQGELVCQDFDFLCVDAPNTLSGDVSGFTKATYLSCEGNCTLTGSIEALTDLWFLAVGGNSTLSGSINGLTKLEVFAPGPCTITKPVRFNNNSRLSAFYGVGAGSTWVWTSEQVNQLLADILANKDVARVNAPVTYRTINLVGAAGTGAPTGQGITDKAALQAYRSPDNNPIYALWTITTN